jgi:diguanylate cyclase (GGDEF)-like protein
MDKLMQWLAPRGAAGFALRFILLVGIVAIFNLLFSQVYDDHGIHEPSFYILHAVFVGGPLIGFFLAVTVFQIRLQRKLWQLSRKDGLTTLNNRNTFFIEADKRRATGNRGVLLMLDADHFKALNDTHGHQAGDRCLKQMARVLRRSLRSNDIVGRLGGEEFAIYVHDASLEDARMIAERLTLPIRFTTQSGKLLEATLSIGAVVDHPKYSLEEICNYADKALYRAKSIGRAQLVVWDEMIADSAIGHVSVGNAARH